MKHPPAVVRAGTLYWNKSGSWSHCSSSRFGRAHCEDTLDLLCKQGSEGECATSSSERAACCDTPAVRGWPLPPTTLVVRHYSLPTSDWGGSCFAWNCRCVGGRISPLIFFVLDVCESLVGNK